MSFCLKWTNHMNNMMDGFQNLLVTESMVDVTLVCDGLSLKAHKIVLSACSPLFQTLFLENPCQHPIVILKDVKHAELEAIIEFMYHGKINVAQDQLSALMKTAEVLKVKGLAEVPNEKSRPSQEDSWQSHTSGEDSWQSHTSAEDSWQSHTFTSLPQNKQGKVRDRKGSLSGSGYSDCVKREPKIKQPTSPDIEEHLVDMSMDNSRQFQNVPQSRVTMQSHSSNLYHKTSSQGLKMKGRSSEIEPGVEPAKLLQQALTAEEARLRRLSTLFPALFEPKSSTGHSMGMDIVPASLASDERSQQPESSPENLLLINLLGVEYIYGTPVREPSPQKIQNLKKGDEDQKGDIFHLSQGSTPEEGENASTVEVFDLTSGSSGSLSPDTDCETLRSKLKELGFNKLNRSTTSTPIEEDLQEAKEKKNGEKNLMNNSIPAIPPEAEVLK